MKHLVVARHLFIPYKADLIIFQTNTTQRDTELRNIDFKMQNYETVQHLIKKIKNKPRKQNK